MFSFSTRDMGIDLGTANTLIYMKEKGIILNQPSCIAYDKNLREIIAVGESAKDMFGKTPANIVVVKPLQDGVISDFDMTEEMLVRARANAKKGGYGNVEFRLGEIEALPVDSDSTPTEPGCSRCLLGLAAASLPWPPGTAASRRIQSTGCSPSSE